MHLNGTHLFRLRTSTFRLTSQHGSTVVASSMCVIKSDKESPGESESQDARAQVLGPTMGDRETHTCGPADGTGEL